MAGLTLQFYNGTDLYAEMTTSGGTSFDLHFVAEGVEPGGYIDYVALAGPGGTFSNLGTDAIATGSYSAGGFTDQGETFNWKIAFPNQGNQGGAPRLTAGEHGLWSIEVTDPDVWNFNKIHINAFNAIGGSIKLDGCIEGTVGCGGGGGGGDDEFDVPEPASLALVGLALASAGLSTRRRCQRG